MGNLCVTYLSSCTEKNTLSSIFIHRKKQILIQIFMNNSKRQNIFKIKLCLETVETTIYKCSVKIVNH